MYQPLVPCTDCRRHIRAADARCPFCATPVTARVADHGPTARMSRAVAVAVAAIALAGCRSEPETAPIARDPVAVKPSADPTAPAPPAPSPAPLEPGEVDDHGGVGTKYGAPPPPKPHPPKPNPVAVPAYGAPPPHTLP